MTPFMAASGFQPPLFHTQEAEVAFPSIQTYITCCKESGKPHKPPWIAFPAADEKHVYVTLLFIFFVLNKLLITKLYILMNHFLEWNTTFFSRFTVHVYWQSVFLFVCLFLCGIPLSYNSTFISSSSPPLSCVPAQRDLPRDSTN